MKRVGKQAGREVSKQHSLLSEEQVCPTPPPANDGETSPAVTGQGLGKTSQSSIEQRTFFMKQLRDINQRVRNALQALEEEDSPSYCMDQVKVYKEQVCRMMSRFQEAARDREKALAGVSGFFQRILEGTTEGLSTPTASDTSLKQLLKGVHDHKFTKSLESSSSAFDQLQEKSDDLTAFTKDILQKYKAAVQQPCTGTSQDELLKGQRDRLMEEVSSQAFKNIKLANALSEHERKLLEMQKIVVKMTSEKSIPPDFLPFCKDLSRVCGSVTTFHSTSSSLLASIEATDGQQQLPQQQRQQQQLQQQQQLPGSSCDLDHRGRSPEPALLDHEVVPQQSSPRPPDRASRPLEHPPAAASGVSGLLETWSRVGSIAQQRVSGERSRTALLQGLHEEFVALHKESADQVTKHLHNSPLTPGEGRGLLEELGMKMLANPDLTNPIETMASMEQAVKETASSVEELHRRTVTAARAQISKLSADRSLAPEIMRARKEKYLKSLEVFQHSSKHYQQLVRTFSDKLNQASRRVPRELARKRGHYSSELAELDRRLNMHSTELERTSPTTAQHDDDDDVATKTNAILAQARSLVSNLSSEAVLSEASCSKMAAEVDLVRQALEALGTGTGAGAGLAAAGAGCDHGNGKVKSWLSRSVSRSSQSSSSCRSVKDRVSTWKLPKIEPGIQQSGALSKAVPQTPSQGNGNKLVQITEQVAMTKRRQVKQNKHDAIDNKFPLTELPKVKAKRHPAFSSFHGYRQKKAANKKEAFPF